MAVSSWKMKADVSAAAYAAEYRIHAGKKGGFRYARNAIRFYSVD
jgi:hypothetical protein